MSSSDTPIWIIRIILAAVLLTAVLQNGSPNPIHIFLACVGGLLIIISLIWGRWLSHFKLLVFRNLKPTFIPSPRMHVIPPVRKTVLKVITPKKVKIGTSTTITVELYEYTVPPYLDISDTILKNIFRETTHPPYGITLETPSFDYTPRGEVTMAAGVRYPLKWKWVIEPKTLGKKELLLYVNEEVLKSLEDQSRFETPLVIAIEVISELGISSRTAYWLRRITIVVGFLLGLPFLSPVFQKIGSYISRLFK